MSLKHLIFDLDGTLVDSWQANYESYRLAFAEQGLELSASAYRSAFGLPFAQMIQRLAPHLSEEHRAEVKAAKARHYAEHLHLVKVNQRLLDFALALGPSVSLSLVTGSRRVNAQALLQHLGWQGIFQVQLFAEDCGRGKPSPDPYLKALELLQAQPQDCLVFEDSPPGIASAQAAGLQVLAIPAGMFGISEP